MLPTIDFTQQLAQLQAQLNNLGTPQQNLPANVPAAPVDPKSCPSKLPCGICTRTNLMCAMEEKTDE